jgi:tetratricopeptide (TPR) repeat protein
MKSRHLLLVAVLCAHAFISCQSKEENATSVNPSILKRPPYRGLTDSIDAAPNDWMLRLQRATLLSQHNRHELANADYEAAWKMSNDESVALELISNMLLVNQVPEAVQLLKQCIEKYPESGEFQRRLAEVYLQTGETGKARRQYENIIAADSTNFEAWHDLGSLLLQVEDTAAAIQALERSFAIVPLNYTGLALAEIYATSKNSRALAICDMLLMNDSTQKQTDPLFLKGLYYSETGQHEQAIAQFDEVIRRDWKLTDAYIEKGLIYFHQKKFDEALKVFTLSATVSNTNADSYYWIGRCHEKKGQPKEAIANYERALALDENLYQARERLARLTQ